MCLIVLAHRMSARYPLLIAANRDEEYQRPSLPAALWEGENIAGGRDAVHGGSWLAVTRAGRFAAVTNLRGAIRTNQPRSRGELVTGFVRGDGPPSAYLQDVATRIDDYGGFHLLAGEAQGDLAMLSGSIRPLGRGIHGLSNAPAGVTWPKVEVAVEALRGALEMPDRTVMIDRLMRLLRTAPAHGDPTRDLFITGEQYGTRASTVIVVEEGIVHFIEQSFGRGGIILGDRQELRFPLRHGVRSGKVSFPDLTP
jgi:uncharacterized protein with NRDE domain